MRKYLTYFRKNSVLVIYCIYRWKCIHRSQKTQLPSSKICFSTWLIFSVIYSRVQKKTACKCFSKIKLELLTLMTDVLILRKVKIVYSLFIKLAILCMKSVLIRSLIYTFTIFNKFICYLFPITNSLILSSVRRKHE